MFPQVVLIYDRYKKASPNRKATVEIRITFNKKQKYISTKISLFPHQWKKGVIVNTPDAALLNKQLNDLLSDVKEVVYDMCKEGNPDIFAISQRLNERRSPSDSFLKYCEERSEIKKYGKAIDTQDRYNRFLRLFKQWGKIKSFSDITEYNIILFDKYLRDKGMKTNSIWCNYHRFLNSFIRDAIDGKLLSKNPYRWVNIDKSKKGESIKRYLTPEELYRIKHSIMPTQSLERVRDLFIFQTYTCLAYSDLRQFDSSNIKKVKGISVYTGKRKKTGEDFIIPLLPQAIKILNKYNGKPPIISNVKYNEYLKIVAQAASIDKPISSHWARHTGATLLLNSGIDMKVVSKICGHSTTKITEQVYGVRQLNCVKLLCRELLGDNPERPFLGKLRLGSMPSLSFSPLVA